MAITGDLHYNKFNFSTLNRAWSFGLWTEVTTPTTPSLDAGVVSRALVAHFQTVLQNVIQLNSNFESVQSWRRHAGTERPGYTLVQGGAGTRAGDALPNDNALLVNLYQSAQDAKFNGSIYLAGQSDSDHLANEWNAAYLNTQVKAFTDAIPGFINAVGPDTGQIRVVVVSKTFQPASTPIGTAFDVTSAAGNKTVMSQRRRKQRVQGYVTSAV